MENKKLSIDRTKLTSEQHAQLASFEHNKKQIQTLEDIAAMTQEVVTLIGKQQETGNMDKMGAILMDIRESLQAIKDKEDLEIPDNSKVIVDAVIKMEKSLSTAIRAIEVKPLVKVDAPQVNVSPSHVDLKGIEKAFTQSIAEISKNVKEAISSIPKTEKADYSLLLKAWEGISEQLLSIETATRMKPVPGVMKVTNPDGSNVISGNVFTESAIYYKRLDDTTTLSMIYIGEATPGTATSASTWRIKRLDVTTGLIIQWAGTGTFNQVWNNRASLTYV